MGTYDRFGNCHNDPAWRHADDADDRTQGDDEDTNLPEPPEYDLDPQDIDFLEQDEAYEAMMEDFDRRVSDLYDTQNGDIETNDSNE